GSVLQEREDESPGGDARHALEAAEHDDAERLEKERAAEIRREGIERREKCSGKPGERRADAERDGGDAVRIHAREERGVTVLGDGPDRFAEVGPVEDELEDEQREPGHPEDEKRGHADAHAEEGDRLESVGREDRLRVAAPDDVGEVLEDEPDAEEKEEALHRRRRARTREAPHHGLVEEDAAREEHGHDDEGRKKGVEREAREERERRVGPEHHDPRVREVDDAHDPVDHREAVRHRGIQTRGEEGVDDDVQSLLHGPAVGAYPFGIGATGSPVRASFGHTMSTFPSGLFCVTTKGRTAWPVFVNFRTPPGRIESFSSIPASAARMASGFSEPAFWIAAKSARTVSYAVAWYHCGAEPAAAFHFAVNAFTCGYGRRSDHQPLAKM